MKITITDDDMTIHVHTEEVLPVQIIKVNPSDTPGEYPDDEILAIGERSIEAREGGNVDQFNRDYYKHQLLEALAALRFFDTEGMN